jgi:hypothetical protein
MNPSKDEPRIRDERQKFDLIDQEIVASQVVAIMDAHWARPDAEQKRYILRRAEQQIEAALLITEVQKAS